MKKAEIKALKETQMEVSLKSICTRYSQILQANPVPVIQYHLNASQLNQEALLELCEIIPTLTDAMEANRLLGRLQAVMGMYHLLDLNKEEIVCKEGLKQHTSK